MICPLFEGEWIPDVGFLGPLLPAPIAIDATVVPSNAEKGLMSFLVGNEDGLGEVENKVPKYKLLLPEDLVHGGLQRNQGSEKWLVEHW